YLNRQGVQHRDIKPQNLLLVGGGVKVADFGLAKLLEQTVATASGGMTPAYASPEQVNDQVSRWSDQYSLAVTYCHLRGGRLPFAGNLAALVAGHLMSAPDLEMLPAGERPAVARALAKNPQERWPNCAAFVEALDTARTRSVPAPRPVPVPRPTKPISPRPGLPWVIGALGLLAAVLLAIVLGRLSSSANSNPSSSTDPQGRAAQAPPLKPPQPAGENHDKKALPKQAEAPQKGDGKRPPQQPDPGPPGVLPHEIKNSIGMRLVLIPAGTFIMGSPPTEVGDYEDEHKVEITRPFYMGVYEVTQAQYERVMGSNPSWFSAGGVYRDRVAGMDTSDFPVDGVSWDAAVAFCRRLSALPAEKEAGRAYHLPTEAEWEYACRGGPVSSRAPFHFLKPAKLLYLDEANIWPEGRAKKPEPLRRPCKVGSYESNRLGLFDMHGNVWEWCADWYDRNYYRKSPERDPEGPESSPQQQRVLRGGAYSEREANCRAARRFHLNPDNTRQDLGFRVVFRPDTRK
ncbi:MAG: SUMF1/EgtB/PvdO family nonheme iron enzyme, partial [Gemmataceae bacterium]|nr:SUMF1/EgtB/PvdO family nonheme iron enzyme [Gemmataceae bacterium]